MLTEYRKLVFPDSELIQAITAHDEVSMKLLGSRDLVKIEATASPELKIVAKLRGEDGRDEPVQFEYSYVVAAMVRYCVEHKIPLPRRGEKLIELDEGRLALSISMDGTSVSVDDESYYVLL